MNRMKIALLAGVASLGFASTTFAADLIVDAPEVVMPGIVESDGGWDGAYVGVFGGYAWGEADDDADAGGFGIPQYYPEGIDIELDGWLVGVRAGANFTLTEGIVAGVVGDIAWSDISGEFDESTGPYNYDGTLAEIDWQGSARDVLGFDGGSFMPYLTAGLAVAHAWRESPYSAEPVEATHVGWTAGAGVAVALTEQLSANLEYRYSDFGTETYDWPEVNATDREVNLTTHALTVGLNFGF